jgi:Amt family ammonium transporter
MSDTVAGVNITELADTAAGTAATLEYFIKNVDVFYTLYCGSLIFLMQCGFAMLCAGSVRQKNVKNIMLKNILDACGGAIGYWSIGFALAYGDDGKFIGATTEKFFLNDYTGGGSYIDFFFQWTFAATAATIVAGTVAERCKMQAYLFYSVFLTAFVYPVVVHAIWNGNGFLSAFNSDALAGVGMIDFAGSGVVHMTGGATALVGAIILGPRIGRFYDEDGNVLAEPASFAPHSVALQVLGTFILWFGWYGFNPGSTLFISPEGYGDIAGLCAVTTTLSAAAGSISALFTDTLLGMMKTGEAEYDLSMAMNGALGGLVGITANCSVVAPWAAVMIGLISGVVYKFSSALLVKLKIDDAVDAVPVHFFCGIWGCLATGLFADPNRVAFVYGADGRGGLFYGAGGHLLGVEIAGVLFVMAWAMGIMTPFFLALNAVGMFRVDPTEEKVGLDISHHGGAAYDLSGAEKEDIAELEEKRATAHGTDA